ncbi:MAG TPA: XamI family restriction endonuclease [Xanthobacteraceae bacterium]|nr:XamI family restriction endonuclease [Xanthobacteraceae bacterium]
MIASAALAASSDVGAKRRNTSKEAQEQAVKELLARLKDGRVMAIECKVSNSTVNSYKRLVHDTGGKAAHWYNQLGRAQVIPSAVLSGVYSTTNLEDVQDSKGVYLFWQHRLDDLAAFVKRSK